MSTKLTKEEFLKNLVKDSYYHSRYRDLSEVVFNPNQNAVVQKYDLEGNLIQEYPTISAASKDSGISRTHIKHSIEGRGKCIDNYIWKYK